MTPPPRPSFRASEHGRARPGIQEPLFLPPLLEPRTMDDLERSLTVFLQLLTLRSAPTYNTNALASKARKNKIGLWPWPRPYTKLWLIQAIAAWSNKRKQPKTIRRVCTEGRYVIPPTRKGGQETSGQKPIFPRKTAEGRGHGALQTL